jgi:GGDEF domain-containing protein
VRRPVEIETRVDWMAALRHESARHARYGRAVAVLLIELRGQPPGAEADRIARTTADVICAAARETDRVTRVGALSFRLLIPETRGRAARSLVDRLERAFRATPDGATGDVVLTIEVASAARRGSFEDAFAEAERRVAASGTVAASTGQSC